MKIKPTIVIFTWVMLIIGFALTILGHFLGGTNPPIWHYIVWAFVLIIIIAATFDNKKGAKK